jgi:hypothetical protein
VLHRNPDLTSYTLAVRARSGDKRYEVVDEERCYELRDDEDFDRIAFTMRALDLLRPKMTVVVYERVSDLRIERSLDPARGALGRVALVGIPPHASREHIAFEIASLAGGAERPWLVSAVLALPTQAAEAVSSAR